MSSEANFVISHNFTTIRGESYEEFLANLTAVYGEEDAKSLAAVAFSELRNRFVGAPTVGEAESNLRSGVGATPAPAATPAYSGGYSGNGDVALDVPYADKDKVKAAGARWNKDRKAWTVPQGHPLTQQFKVKA